MEVLKWMGDNPGLTFVILAIVALLIASVVEDLTRIGSPRCDCNCECRYPEAEEDQDVDS